MGEVPVLPKAYRDFAHGNATNSHTGKIPCQAV
jgi:hypothetical protein